MSDLPTETPPVKSGPSPHSVSHWSFRIFHKRKVIGGVVYLSPEWSVRLQYARRREYFNLRTCDAKEAAIRARAIAVFLEVNGWESTLAKFKARAVALNAPATTVGQFLRAIEATALVRPKTFQDYASKLRWLVADIGHVPEGKDRFDYRTGGNLRWRAAVDAKALSILSPSAINQWRARYVKMRDSDPKQRRSAERTSASVIRCARALFSTRLTAGMDLPQNPFAGLKLAAPRPDRYHSAVDATALLRQADAELRPADPQAYLAFSLCFWAGLRKKEADNLTWDQVDETNRQIHVRRTRYFEIKTAESERDVDLPAAAMEVIGSFRRSRGVFVLQGTRARPNAPYQFYRAQTTWKRLSDWLRSKGVKEQKAIHSLRKESGSIIAQQFGIEAARAHLGHSDIQITSAVYVSKRQRYEVTLPMPLPLSVPRADPTSGGPAAKQAPLAGAFSVF